jgi:PAS domain S-box-containing protein
VLETIGRLVGMAVGNARLRDSLEARQQALDASEARYKTLFDEAPQPILIQSLDGVVIDANHAAAALYRRPRSELIGRVVGDVASIAPDELRRQTEMLLRQRRGVFSGTGIRADGTRFPEEVDIAVASIEGHDRLLVQVRDLSAHERLQAELLQAQKMASRTSSTTRSARSSRSASCCGWTSGCRRSSSATRIC